MRRAPRIASGSSRLASFVIVVLAVVTGAAGLLPSATATAATPSVASLPTATVATTAIRRFGQGPLNDVLYWADQLKGCGLARDELAAMMLVPIFTETGAGTQYVPSPMTLSRWDYQSDGLYAFNDKNSAYHNAFFHPGAGMWQFDSAGGWDLTASDAINASTSAHAAATVLSQRWCANASQTDAAARRAFAWFPWSYCYTRNPTYDCEGAYQALVGGAGLVANIATDPTVTSLGGMVEHSCTVGPITVACFYVDPAQAQGLASWRVAGFGPSPITAPFYVFRSNGREYRYWLRQDTGYDATIVASKLVTANARTGITWSKLDDLCDTTAVRGACGRSPFGSIDVAAGGGGHLVVQGWVIDPDTTAAITARLLVNGTEVAATSAALARPDVGTVFPSYGANHGYLLEATGLTPGPKTVCLRGDNTGLGTDAVIGCVTVTMPTGSPFGSLDVATGGIDQITVAGWAVDPDTTAPIAVHIYVDGVGAALLTANQARPDLASVFPAYGNAHGYSATVAVAGGTHQVCAWAIDVAPGANTARCRTVTVAPGPPIGFLDVVTPAFGSAIAAGWAIDPTTTAPIAIHIYVDGTFRGQYVAAATRPDVGAVFPSYGSAHGFVVPLFPMTAGNHFVCAYGINDAVGENSVLGCRTVTVDGTPTGSLDAAGVTGGTLRLQGWAIDPDTTAPISVRVLVDGVVVQTAVANGTRADVGAAYGFGNQHGFDTTVAFTATGSRQVCVDAVNTGSGSDRRIGCVVR